MRTQQTRGKQEEKGLQNRLHFRGWGKNTYYKRKPMTIRNTDSCIFFNCDSWDKDRGEDFFLATPHSLWDLPSPTRDGTCIPCRGSTESQPLDRKGIPASKTFWLLNRQKQLWNKWCKQNKHSIRGALQPLDPVKRKVVGIIQRDQGIFQLGKPYITYTSVPAPSFLLVEFSFYQCAHVKH